MYVNQHSTPDTLAVTLHEGTKTGTLMVYAEGDANRAAAEAIANEAHKHCTAREGNPSVVRWISTWIGFAADKEALQDWAATTSHEVVVRPEMEPPVKHELQRTFQAPMTGTDYAVTHFVCACGRDFAARHDAVSKRWMDNHAKTGR